MSVKKCCVPNCNTTRNDNIIMHLFPNPDKDLERFITWKNAIGGHILTLDNYSIFDHRRVCHLHFQPCYYTRSKRLSPNAVPTLQLSGYLASIRRQPMEDVTNRESRPTENFGASQLNSTQSTSNASNSRQVLDQSVELELMIPTMQPSTSSPLTKRAFNIQNYGKKKIISPEIVSLGNKIKLLQRAKDSLKAKLKKVLKLSKNPTFCNTLKKFTTAAVIFTMLQFRESGKKKLGRRFKQDEKIMALALYKQGPRAYRWLRKFFVLPSPMTLNRTIRNASLKPGINEKLFYQLKKVAGKMTTTEKLCVLMFDEVALSPHFDFNKRNDSISGFVDTGDSRKKKIADHALVFMVRGIHKNYKQPLMYSFCSGTTPRDELVVQIKTVLRKLSKVGFKVVATICDQGATNVSAINYLVNETRSNYVLVNKNFIHNTFEIEGNEIIPLYDTPHLIKGIRNNLINKHLKCTINGEQKIGKWDHITKLYHENPAYQGIRLMPKLTERHVIPNKISKMKVKCATQVFSQTVAANMGYLANHGILPKECQETADILIFFDRLFDSLNGSYNKSQKKGGKPLLGPVTPTSIHLKVWREAKPILKSMKFIKNEKLCVVPSISNWLQTIENVEYMVKTLSQKYGLTSIWMRHFNQDPLENFFGCIRSHGHRNTSPTCAGFEAAFASLLVNNFSNNHSPGSNCEVDSCKVFTSLKTIFFGKCQTSNCAVEVDFDDVAYVNFQDVHQKMANAKIKAQLEFVTGYVLRKLKVKIFKNCMKCNENLINSNKNSSALIAREYFIKKSCLTYPSIHIIRCFSNIQDTIIHILRKDSTKVHIKAYIRTVLSVVIDYNFIECSKHKHDMINQLENISINLFIFNWCKDTNKIIKGNRTDYEESDVIQKMSFDYYKKHSKR